MFGSDYDGADSHCVRCGAPIWFEVGPGTARCPACGENPDYTDEQLRERAVADKKAARAARDGMSRKRKACELLHRLKARCGREDADLLDYAMTRVCMFEADNVRNGKPSLIEGL